MKIKNATFEVSALSLDTCPASTLPEFAFIGRSNVGKSSLLNLLTNHGGLARVSNTPGRTREMNFFNVNDTWTLVDLPGYGYARGPKEDKEKFNEFVSDYLVERQNLCCAFVLIDSRHEPQRKDLDFVRWMVESQVPFALAYTKADKVKPKLVQKHIGMFKEAMAAWSEGVPEIFVTSAKTKDGRVELLKFIGTAILSAKGGAVEGSAD